MDLIYFASNNHETRNSHQDGAQEEDTVGQMREPMDVEEIGYLTSAKEQEIQDSALP
jgi:hypothetical protein